jgi:hypothetical protein
MKFMCTAAVAALVALGSVASADAATVTLHSSDPQGPGNDAGLGFAQGYGANTPGGAGWGGPAPVVVGNSSGNWQSPFNSNGLTEITSYFSANPAQTLTFTNLQTSFGLLWGSIDSYNTISFLDSIGNEIASWTGSQIVSDTGLGGSPANYEQVGLFSFDFGQNEAFKSVVFSSSQAAFEFALAPAPVPLPAAGLLLIAGVAGLGAAGRKRRQS